ncbi:MAG: glycyl-radical enzyme activating protein [Armatimonadota bacterium]
MQKGLVFDIQRFCTHDGPGIRTVVFLKGCPLNCAWCHNPESKKRHRELFYNPALCINCGNCVTACPTGSHRMIDGVHQYSRENCSLCMQCADRCFSGAIEAVGKETTVADVLAEVEKDRTFYEESGGGVTLSGGEPMAQFEFSLALMKAAKESGIDTCIETSGFAAEDRFIEIAPYVDLLFWDIKDTDELRHQANTGVPLAPVISSLRAVDAAGKSTILRCIMLAGVNLNHQHLDGIASLFRDLRHCLGVELLPCHVYGNSKYSRLGMIETIDSGCVPTEDQMDEARLYLTQKWGIETL